jgi:glucan phosphoethanolaminetransferase (alkaline phosphatase superfamily)
MLGRNGLSGLAMDVVAWHCMPAAFLFAYVDRNLLPADAVGPHLRVVWLVLLGLALFRMVVSLSGISAAAARVVTSLTAAALLALMLSYYVVVLVGLQSWGRVVSWDLITSYGEQVLRLSDTLGIPLPVAVGVAALGYLALLLAVWAYLGHFDWTAFLRRTLSARLFALLLFAGSMVWAIELYGFVAGPPTQQFEPVSLTFNPNEGAWDVQGHAIDGLKVASLDAAEDGARKRYVPGSSADRKNVVLIVVDALRPDHMGVYGYGRDTTPNLDRLEKAGMLRKAASVRASCGSSFCGLLSISSSRFLHQFSERAITLQEALKRHGYRIHMILSGNHALFYGLRKAYGEVDTYFDAQEKRHEKRTIEYMNDDRLVLERLSRFPSWDGDPVMIQFHLMSAHPLGGRDGGMAKYAPAANYSLVVNRDPRTDGRPSERAINYYDNGVLQADAMIRGILETLERKGYLENTVVAITADHGEALGEHGLFQHANSVREEVLRIPFVLLSYGYRPAKSLEGHKLASQIDIAPTLLAELGMPRPDTWQGAPLQQRVSRDFLYFQEMWEVGLFDLRDSDNLWKYWTNIKTGEEYAFNLTIDPRERLNGIGKASPEQKRDWRLQLLAKGQLRVKGRPAEDPTK